jgi:hypothetical protein
VANKFFIPAICLQLFIPSADSKKADVQQQSSSDANSDTDGCGNDSDFEKKLPGEILNQSIKRRK